MNRLVGYARVSTATRSGSVADMGIAARCLPSPPFAFVLPVVPSARRRDRSPRRRQNRLRGFDSCDLPTWWPLTEAPT